MINRVLCLTMVIILFPNCSYAKCEMVEEQITSVSTTINDGSEITIRLVTSENSTDNPFRQGIWWGSRDSQPGVLISRLSVIWSDQPCHIPVSAHIDLTNPHKLCADASDNKLIITISGGDASTSYSATILLVNGIITEKNVEHGEFPKECHENTTYSFHNID